MEGVDGSDMGMSQLQHHTLVLHTTQGLSGTDEITTIGNAARLQRLDERARPKASRRLIAKEKCFLVLACIGLLLGSAFLRRQSASGFFFQGVGELL
jgi:hypothetical protein